MMMINESLWMTLTLQLSTTVLFVSWSLSLSSRQNVLMGNYLNNSIIISLIAVTIKWVVLVAAV